MTQPLGARLGAAALVGAVVLQLAGCSKSTIKPEGAAQYAELPALVTWVNRMEERQSLQVTRPPGM